MKSYLHVVKRKQEKTSKLANRKQVKLSEKLGKHAGNLASMHPKKRDKKLFKNVTMHKLQKKETHANR